MRKTAEKTVRREDEKSRFSRMLNYQKQVEKMICRRKISRHQIRKG